MVEKKRSVIFSFLNQFKRLFIIFSNLSHCVSSTSVQNDEFDICIAFIRLQNSIIHFIIKKTLVVNFFVFILFVCILYTYIIYIMNYIGRAEYITN